MGMGLGWGRSGFIVQSAHCKREAVDASGPNFVRRTSSKRKKEERVLSACAEPNFRK
jgi:hypothetical protein